MSKDNGGPAFPGGFSETEQDDHVRPFNSGMTLRQYAAIKLRVPDSGTDWLDEMIRTSQRDYFAVHASEKDVLAQAENMRGYRMARGEIAVLPDDWVTAARYMHADAMLEAMKK